MDFKSALEKQVLVMDGAMGTMVQALHLDDAAFGGAEFRMLTDLLTFSRPAELENIHLQYLQAGANILESNTFGASPLRLKEFEFARIDARDIRHLPPGLDLQRADLASLTRHMNIAAVRTARQAIARYKQLPEYDGRPLFVAGSIGPSNYVVSSTQANLKRATFAEIADNFRPQVAALIEGGADLILFETQQDILETKAAVIAAHKVFAEAGKALPIVVQVTVDTFGKMQIFNTDILAAYTAVAHMGIDVFGMNCNIGPELMTETVKRLARFCNHPISVIPNAGQPVAEDGKTCYKLAPADMAATMEPFVRESGVAIVGGCCGTNPDHIRALCDRIRAGGVPAPKRREPDTRVFVSGPQEAVHLDSSKFLVRIGEQLNVRGSKKVREAVEREGGIKTDVLEEVARELVKDLGVDIIDICMDSNIVETEKVLPQVIHDLTADFKGVICIDSFSVEALERAIETYPGRPIVNSYSLEEYAPGVSKLDAVLAATRAHGPVYIALVNGPAGPGMTAEEKYNLAAEIVRQSGEEYGVTPAQILVDVNAYPIGSESVEGLNFCAETLKCLPMIKAIHPDLKTTIGVGNLTNGLAQKPYMRKVLTSVFLHEARAAGLDCAILNPNLYVPMESLPPEDVELGRKVILDRDMNAFAELERIALTKKTGEAVKTTDYTGMPVEDSICRKILDGYKSKEEGALEKDGGTFPYHDRIVLETAQAIDKHAPLDFISQYLVKTMRELGDRFGRGEVSLPHLLKSADIMRNVMSFLENYMLFKSGAQAGAIKHKGVVVLGTVFQDVHSIGKDLAKTLLENYGYRVIDLGVQVPLEKFIETARAENADAIGMSALLVQTSNHMTTVARMLKDQGYSLPLLVGGAPVNWRHAGFVAMLGQDNTDRILDNVFYCESGMDGVNVMNSLMDKSARAAALRQNKTRLANEYRHAKGMHDHKAKLLETLEWRKISFKNHEPPREGFGIHRVEFKLGKLSECIDRKSLYSLNWKFGKQSNWLKLGVTPDHLRVLEQEWLAKAEENQWITPKARFALLPAQSEEDDLIVYDPAQPGREIARIPFTVCVGKGQKDKFSIARCFYTKASGRMDAVGLQITTAGGGMAAAIEDFKAKHDTESALYLQGLSDRIAEDLAEYIHQLLRQRTGAQKKDKHGQRYSPGYPALEDISINRTIYEILQAQDIGVTLTGAGEFSPASTTAAVVCFHPEAGYT